ncbi:hypothetical protein GCM10027456_00320 [Kineosporia babensis]
MVGTAVVVVLFILGCRWVVGDNLAVLEKTNRKECVAEQYCVTWVSYPDLLVSKGRDEVHVYRVGQENGRFYSVTDPFAGDVADAEVSLTDGGITVSNSSVTITWSADTLGLLAD